MNKNVWPPVPAVRPRPPPWVSALSVMRQAQDQGQGAQEEGEALEPGGQPSQEWEFTWMQGGIDRHVPARDIMVSPGEHFSVLWAGVEDVGGDHTTWRTAVRDSFEPS